MRQVVVSKTAGERIYSLPARQQESVLNYLEQVLPQIDLSTLRLESVDGRNYWTSSLQESIDVIAREVSASELDRLSGIVRTQGADASNPLLVVAVVPDNTEVIPDASK